MTEVLLGSVDLSRLKFCKNLTRLADNAETTAPVSRCICGEELIVKSEEDKLTLNQDPDVHQDDGIKPNPAPCRHTGFTPVSRCICGEELIVKSEEDKLTLKRDPDVHQDDGIKPNPASCRHTGLAPVSRSCP